MSWQSTRSTPSCAVLARGDVKPVSIPLQCRTSRSETTNTRCGVIWETRGLQHPIGDCGCVFRLLYPQAHTRPLPFCLHRAISSSFTAFVRPSSTDQSSAVQWRLPSLLSGGTRNLTLEWTHHEYPTIQGALIGRLALRVGPPFEPLTSSASEGVARRYVQFSWGSVSRSLSIANNYLY